VCVCVCSSPLAFILVQTRFSYAAEAERARCVYVILLQLPRLGRVDGQWPAIAASRNEWASYPSLLSSLNLCVPQFEASTRMHRIHFALKLLFREQLAEIIVATCASSLDWHPYYKGRGSKGVGSNAVKAYWAYA